jgi:hypothetical protein
MENVYIIQIRAASEILHLEVVRHGLLCMPSEHVAAFGADTRREATFGLKVLSFRDRSAPVLSYHHLPEEE